MSRPPPQVHAMLVCDQVFQMAETGKWCVIGIHEIVRAPEVPAPHPTGVFISLGDFASGSTFQLVVRHESGDELCRADAEAGTDQPVTTIDVGLELPVLPLMRAGTYLFELRQGGTVLATRPLRLLVGDEPPPPPVPGRLAVRALILCDAAFTQHGTNEWHVLGVYDNVNLPALPALHAPFVVFWSLSGFLGDGFVTVVVRDNEDNVVFAVRRQFPRLPGGTLEQAFVFPPIEFKRAGSHTIELLVGERLLSVRSFRVQVLSAPAGQAGRGP